MTKTTPAKPIISEQERAQRKAAVDYGRGSVWLSGFIVSEFAEDLNCRYINGEVTREQKRNMLLAHYGRIKS